MERRPAGRGPYAAANLARPLSRARRRPVAVGRAGAPCGPGRDALHRPGGRGAHAGGRPEGCGRVPCPLRDLLDQPAHARPERDSLAERLSLSVPLVFKLERRLLSFASLPAVLIDRLAEALQVTERQVRDYLNQPPTLAAGANYRADSAPKAVRQQDFLQAVRTDHEMTEEQKAFWSKI